MSTLPKDAHVGFPSPADDYLQSGLNLNEYLIHHKESTFFMRAKGNNMANSGIFDKDMLIVDKSITPVSGNIVIAVVEGELMVKRLITTDDGYILQSDESANGIHIKDEQELLVWGVVTSSTKIFI